MHTTSRRLLALGAAILGIAACSVDPDQAPPTSLEGTGTVQGRLYFDANNNGSYDPLGGDLPIAGKTITLGRRADLSTTGVIATTTTGGDGTFAFATVPIGTHEIRIATDSVRLCASIPVTVAVGEEAYVQPGLRRTCRQDIRVVRGSTFGQLVTVEGRLTVPPNVLTSGSALTNSEVWLQDSTGGIAVFTATSNFPTGLTYGDVVEVTGTLGANSNQIQLTTNPVTVKKGAGAPVDPRVVTGTQLAARTYDGQLVTLPNFTVQSLGTVSATGGYNVNGVAGTGEALQLRINSSTVGIPSSKWTVGQTYAVTGIASVFGSSVQIKPRGLFDITP